MPFMFNRWNIITGIHKCRQRHQQNENVLFFFAPALWMPNIHICMNIDTPTHRRRKRREQSFCQTFLDYLVFSVFLAPKSFSTSKVERDKLRKCRAKRWQICQHYIFRFDKTKFTNWDETELIWLWHLTYYNNGIHIMVYTIRDRAILRIIEICLNCNWRRKSHLKCKWTHTHIRKTGDYIILWQS